MAAPPAPCHPHSPPGAASPPSSTRDAPKERTCQLLAGRVPQRQRPVKWQAGSRHIPGDTGVAGPGRLGQALQGAVLAERGCGFAALSEGSQRGCGLGCWHGESHTCTHTGQKGEEEESSEQGGRTGVTNPLATASLLCPAVQPAVPIPSPTAWLLPCSNPFTPRSRGFPGTH